MTHFSFDMGINNVNFDDDNFDDDHPEIFIHFSLWLSVV